MDPMENLTLAAEALDNAAQRMDQFADEADAQVGEVAARHIGTSSSVYVDQATGDNVNAGTKAAPVATIQRAIDLSPVGLLNRIYVRGDYTTTERTRLVGRKIQIFACHGENWSDEVLLNNRPKLTIGFGPSDGSATPQIKAYGFELSYDGMCNINGYDTELPSETDVEAAFPGFETNSRLRGLFNVGTSGQDPIGSAILRYGDLIVPPDCFCNIMSAHNGGRLYLYSATVVGDLAGFVHPEVPAGTLRADAADHIITNLSTL